MEKHWRPVLGFEEFYEVSECGAVRRIKTQGGRPSFRELKPGFRRDYFNFTLSVGNTQRTFAAHRMVWEAANGPLPAGTQINHKNGDKRDNRLVNLEPCTASENMKHAYNVLGRDVRRPQIGSKNGRSKLTEEDVSLVFAMRREGFSQQKIADRFGVDQTSISNLLLRKTWTNVQV